VLSILETNLVIDAQFRYSGKVNPQAGPNAGRPDDPGLNLRGAKLFRSSRHLYCSRRLLRLEGWGLADDV
jgi:hypothetical protein